MTVGGDRRKEFSWIGLDVSVHEDFARLIYETDVHGLGMQVDSTVELVLNIIESHHGPPWVVVLREPVKIGTRK
jgi:hypothetical protein